MEALRGRDSAEYERLMSEMSRLRESWVTQELARIRAAAREAGLLAQLANVNKVMSFSALFNLLAFIINHRICGKMLNTSGTRAIRS